MSEAAAVARAVNRLEAAGVDLRRRPQAEVVDALGAVLDRLSDSGSPERLQLLQQLPEATGFSRPVVEEGLQRALAGWTSGALHALVEAELGAEHRIARGFPVTSVLLGGALPPPTIISMIAPLVLRSAVLVRPASRDPVTPRIVFDALRAANPTFGRAVEIVPFAHDDTGAMAVFQSAGCVVATGSDEAMRAVARTVEPPKRLVCYGHRVSVAVIGPEARSGSALEEAAAALAEDVALWDQLGCLSPVAVWLLGEREISEEALESFENAFAKVEKRLPRGTLDPQEGAAWSDACATAEMRAASGEARLRGGTSAPWALVAEPDPAVRDSPLHRFLRIHPARTLEDLAAALAPLAPHLATVGVAGLDSERPGLVEAFSSLGASRVCPLGTMQAPPLRWCHDGQPVLLPMARLTDVEG
jgi:hypothetical protein